MRTIYIHESKTLHEYTNEEQHAIRHNIQPQSNKLYNRIKNVEFHFDDGRTWSKRQQRVSSFLHELMQIYTKEAIQTFVTSANVYEMNLYLLNALKSTPMCVLENIEKDAGGNILNNDSIYYEVVKRRNQKVFHIDMNRPWPHVCVFKQLKACSNFNQHTYIVLQRVGTTEECAKQNYLEHLDDDVLLPVRDAMCGRVGGVSVKRVEKHNGRDQVYWDMKGCEIDQTLPENIGETYFLLVSLHDLKNVYHHIVQSHIPPSSSSYESYASTVTTVEMMEWLPKTPVVTSQMINLVMSAMYPNQKKISGK